MDSKLDGIGMDMYTIQWESSLTRKRIATLLGFFAHRILIWCKLCDDLLSWGHSNGFGCTLGTEGLPPLFIRATFSEKNKSVWLWIWFADSGCEMLGLFFFKTIVWVNKASWQNLEKLWWILPEATLQPVNQESPIPRIDTHVRTCTGPIAYMPT